MTGYRHKETGRTYPRVTSIIPDGYKGAPEDAMQEGRIRGTFVHDATALLDQDNLDWDSVPDKYLPYIRAWERAKEELDIRIVPGTIERTMVSHIYGFAGTVDRVITFGNLLTITVPDIKTGDHVDKKMRALWGLQTAGYTILYREAERLIRGKVNRVVIQLHSTGRYRLELLDDPGDHAAFLSFLNTHQWQRNHGLDGLI